MKAVLKYISIQFLSTIKRRFLKKLLSHTLITLNNSLHVHRLSTSARIICLLSTVFWHDDDVTPSICIVWSEWFILSVEFV